MLAPQLRHLLCARLQGRPGSKGSDALSHALDQPHTRPRRARCAAQEINHPCPAQGMEWSSVARLRCRGCKWQKPGQKVYFRVSEKLFVRRIRFDRDLCTASRRNRWLYTTVTIEAANFGLWHIALAAVVGGFTRQFCDSDLLGCRSWQNRAL